MDGLFFLFKTIAQSSFFQFHFLKLAREETGVSVGVRKCTL